MHFQSTEHQITAESTYRHTKVEDRARDQLSVVSRNYDDSFSIRNTEENDPLRNSSVSNSHDFHDFSNEGY